MIRKLTGTENLYVRTMGKALRVTAIATTDNEANAFMEKNDNAAVVAMFGSFVLMADKNDPGITIPRE